MASQIIFSVLAVITLVSAFIVVTDRNLFHAAIAMMLSFVGVAGFYVLLNSGFMAAAQLLVYIGAISILIIFAIMMTRRLMTTTESPFNGQWFQGLLVSVLIFGLLAYNILNFWGPPGSTLRPPTGAPQTLVTGAPVETVLNEQVVELGRSLVSSNGYVLPFELASVLLLAALVGSIVVARPEREEE